MTHLTPAGGSSIGAGAPQGPGGGPMGGQREGRGAGAARDTLLSADLSPADPPLPGLASVTMLALAWWSAAAGGDQFHVIRCLATRGQAGSRPSISPYL